MIPLYEAIRSRNPNGLPREEAVQLFLWIFCTVDFLPEKLKIEPIGKEQLVEVFEALTADGLILKPQATDHGPSDKSGATIDWPDLVRAFLSKRIELDGDFLERAHDYI